MKNILLGSPKHFLTALLLLVTSLFAHNSWAQTIHIGALVTGQVIDVAVKKGQAVKPGQILMKIDDRRYQARLKKAKAELKIRELKLADAKIELEQALDLFDRTVSAKRELDAAQLAHDIAEQKQIQAQAELEKLQSWQAYFVITAPVSARVKAILAPKGTTVYKENTPLIQLEN